MPWTYYRNLPDGRKLQRAVYVEKPLAGDARDREEAKGGNCTAIYYASRLDPTVSAYGRAGADGIVTQRF